MAVSERKIDHGKNDSNSESNDDTDSALNDNGSSAHARNDRVSLGEFVLMYARQKTQHRSSIAMLPLSLHDAATLNKWSSSDEEEDAEADKDQDEHDMGGEEARELRANIPTTATTDGDAGNKDDDDGDGEEEKRSRGRVNHFIKKDENSDAKTQDGSTAILTPNHTASMSMLPHSAKSTGFPSSAAAAAPAPASTSVSASASVSTKPPPSSPSAAHLPTPQSYSRSTSKGETRSKSNRKSASSLSASAAVRVGDLLVSEGETAMMQVDYVGLAKGSGSGNSVSSEC